MQIATRAVHGGAAPDAATGAVTPPIQLTTTYARDEDAQLVGEFIYARTDNPNRRALERCLADLEDVPADGCVTFGSGMAATTAVFHALAPGDHVVAPADVYYGTAKLLTAVFARWGLESTFVDMTDPSAVAAARRPNTRLFWVETPSNPTLAVTDIRGIAEVAHEAGALLACDNTWATPLLQRPFTLGADIVMHSTTKYLSGHSDVTGGAVLARADRVGDAFLAQLRLYQTQGGAIPSPFDCWLTLRGIRSLACRMRTHCDNAERVAEFLVSHPAVETVHYPGLVSDPGHAIAETQMERFGGMVSVQIRGGRDAALGVLRRVQLFTRATSLGGAESLIEHRASVEGPESATPKGLLRLSIGLEDPADLIADLDAALAPLAS